MEPRSATSSIWNMATRLDSSIRHGYVPSPCLPAFTVSSTWMRNWRGLSAMEPSHRGLSPKVPSHQHHPTLTLLLPPPLPQHPRPVPGCISPSSHHLKDPKSPFSPPKSHPGPAGEPHRAGGRAAGRWGGGAARGSCGAPGSRGPPARPPPSRRCQGRPRSRRPLQPLALTGRSFENEAAQPPPLGFFSSVARRRGPRAGSVSRGEGGRTAPPQGGGLKAAARWRQQPKITGQNCGKSGLSPVCRAWRAAVQLCEMFVRRKGKGAAEGEPLSAGNRGIPGALRFQRGFTRSHRKVPLLPAKVMSSSYEGERFKHFYFALQHSPCKQGRDIRYPFYCATHCQEKDDEAKCPTKKKTQFMVTQPIPAFYFSTPFQKILN